LEEKDRREKIIKFISENQPCTAEDLVKGFKDEISRVPVFHTLSELIKEGEVKDQKINRRDHRLVVDTNNPIIEISRELHEFEKAYISFLKKVKEHINRRYYELKNPDYSGPEHITSNVADNHPLHRPLSEAERDTLEEADEFFMPMI
jgi:hypothetical protein